MSSLLALLYLICNRSRRLVRSLIWFTEFIFYNVQWQSWIFTGVVGHDCLHQLKMILSGVDALCIFLLFVKFNHRSVKVKANSVGSKLINGEKWHMEIARPLCTCGQPVDVTNRLVERSLDQNTKGISDRFSHQIMNSRNTCQGT